MKRLAGLTIGLLLLSVNAFGTPISFRFAGIGSGTLAGVGFTDAVFEITAAGDTASRSSFGNGFWIDHTAAIISIAGLGVLDFTTGTRTFVNNGNSMIGFSRSGLGGSDLFNLAQVAGANTWDMLSNFGPATSTSSQLLQWSNSPVNTNLGTLVFSNATLTGTFQAKLGVDRACLRDCKFGTSTRSGASIASVPEPSPLLLLCLGITAIFFVPRRHI
jgi:hypothetical protein